MEVEIKTAIDMPIAKAEIGLVKKMKGLPLDIMSDWRNAFSIIGPRTKAKTKGASSYLYFLRTYPLTPKTTITRMSKTLLLML